jgi:hypothetical protein
MPGAPESVAPVLLALLPSPLLGPSVWEPVAGRLRVAGWAAEVCRPLGSPTSGRDVLAGLLDVLPAGRPLVLVPHSNAGLYVPQLVHEREVVATVFVDAALAPAEGAAALAPEAFLDFLETRADADGLLPPWTRWWDDADVDVLFPDRATRRRVEAEQPRLPLAYFRDALPVPARWLARPSAYLAFGDTYADEREQARQQGWPVETLVGEHLHMLVDPDEVAATITGLLGRLGVGAPAVGRRA